MLSELCFVSEVGHVTGLIALSRTQVFPAALLCHPQHLLHPKCGSSWTHDGFSGI